MTTKKFKPATDNLPRVSRGGAWSSTTATFVRAALRSGDAPSIRYCYVGFRCAQRGAKMPVGKGTP